MAEAGEEMDAIPHSYRAAGDVVLVSGTWRVRGPGGLEERTAHWIYRLQDGRLVSVEGCASLAECERILAEEGGRNGRSRSVPEKIGPRALQCGAQSCREGSVPGRKGPALRPSPSAGRSICVTGS